MMRATKLPFKCQSAAFHATSESLTQVAALSDISATESEADHELIRYVCY